MKRREEDVGNKTYDSVCYLLLVYFVFFFLLFFEKRLWCIQEIFWLRGGDKHKWMDEEIIFCFRFNRIFFFVISLLLFSFKLKTEKIH